MKILFRAEHGFLFHHNVRLGRKQTAAPSCLGLSRETVGGKQGLQKKPGGRVLSGSASLNCSLATSLPLPVGPHLPSSCPAALHQHPAPRTRPRPSPRLFLLPPCPIRTSQACIPLSKGPACEETGWEAGLIHKLKNGGW